MFKNAGAKLMSLAKVIFGIYVAIFLIVAIAAGVTTGGVGGFFVFLISLLVGIVIAWLSTILLYAFGELCENTKAIREGMGYSAPQAQQVDFGQFGQMASNFGNSVSNAASNVGSRFQKAPQPQSMAAAQWMCPNCGKPNGPENAFCTGCGCTKN